MSDSTFIFVRHGEAQGLRERLAGRTPGIPLTELGRQQAAATAERIARLGPGRLLASPQRRTEETARVIGERCGLPVGTHDAFNEFDYGEWTGLTFAQIEEMRAWKDFNAMRSVARAPGGESLREVQIRVVNALLTIHRDAPDQSVCIVTHADVVRAALAFFAGLPLDLYLRIRIDLASVSVVELNPWTATIGGINWTP